jgi:predicted RNase H-like HicB family nuclease
MIQGAPYRFTIRPLFEDEGRGYLIEFPDLPGRMSDGATIGAAITNGLDAMRGLIEAIRAEGPFVLCTDQLHSGMNRRPSVRLVDACEMNL